MKLLYWFDRQAFKYKHSNLICFFLGIGVFFVGLGERLFGWVESA